MKKISSKESKDQMDGGGGTKNVTCEDLPCSRIDKLI